MFTGGRISHICFDVENIEEAAKSYGHLLGAECTEVVTVPLEDGAGVVKTVFFHLDGGSIELVEHHFPPSWGDTPLKTGPGFHHVAMEVSALDEALSGLEKQGIRPLPKFPIKTPHGRIAFLDPKQTEGILWEVAEKKGAGSE